MDEHQLLTRLQNWYAEQCNDDWEHRYGITLTTCDNPGWWMKVDLVGTALVNQAFETVRIGVDRAGRPEGDRWLHCYRQDNIWHGAGDETQLGGIIQRFVNWAESTLP